MASRPERPEQDRFEELYRDHRAAVYRALLRDLRNREDAEDVTQTAFLQAYRAYARGSRPERPRAWLLAIADNLRRRAFRGRERRRLEVALTDDVRPVTQETVTVEDLRAALERLPPNQRSAVVLREVAGLSYDEIARQLRTSVGSVQMLLFRARRSLRDELRRGFALAPPWLTNPFSGLGLSPAVRLPALVAAAAAATAVVATPGAEPSAPAPRAPAAVAAEPRDVAASPAPAARRPATPERPRARAERPRQGAATPRVAATPRGGSRATRPAQARVPTSPPPSPSPAAPPLPFVGAVEPLPLPDLEPPPLPALEPPLALPPVEPPPVPPLPVPALPASPLEQVEDEGALEPQLDGVLAGR